ncbi:MAG: phenylacetate--CoA ligase family protein [Planctomycetota bacterium]
MKVALSRKNLWAAAPRFVRQTVARVADLVPAQVLWGADFRHQAAFVAQADRWSADQAAAYQWQRVREIITLAYERTEYYRQTWNALGFHPADLKTLDDLRRLPTIDKQTLLEHGPRMRARPIADTSVDYVSTGGSSGTPLHFYIGRERSALEFAYLTAAWQRAGYRPGAPLVEIRGRVVPPNRRGLRHEYDPVLRRHYYSNFHTTDDDLRRYLWHVATVGPCFLHVYPSSAATLARFLERSGQPVPSNIRGLLVGSETVFPDERALVERVFGVRYFSWYGHTEKLVLAAECEHSTDYHVFPTYGYFELLNERGQPVSTPGQRGEIVGTGFINTVMPFIRYRTGDYATYAADRCDACGRQHPVLRDVEGRWPSGALVTRDRDLVSMTALNVHDDTFLNVRRYQFYQDVVGEAIVRIVPSNGFHEDDKARILRTLTQRLGDRVTLSLEVCDDIPLTPRGKAIWVEQRLDIAALTGRRPADRSTT